MVSDNERFIPKCINNSENFNRNRINDNLLKVKDEPREVKSLLSLAVQSAKPDKFKHDPYGFNQICYDMFIHTKHADRKDLLRTCVILATSRNTVAQENLIEVISKHIGKIKEKDYVYITKLIYLKDPKIVEQVNDFLSYYLNGYADLYKKYGKQYYAF